MNASAGATVSLLISHFPAPRYCRRSSTKPQSQLCNVYGHHESIRISIRCGALLNTETAQVRPKATTDWILLWCFDSRSPWSVWNVSIQRLRRVFATRRICLRQRCTWPHNVDHVRRTASWIDWRTCRGCPSMINIYRSRTTHSEWCCREDSDNIDHIRLEMDICCHRNFDEQSVERERRITSELKSTVSGRRHVNRNVIGNNEHFNDLPIH